MSGARTEATWSNWAGTASCRPSEITRPRGVDDVLAAMDRARRAGSGVRCVGTGHSFNRSATTDGVLLDMRGLAEVRLEGEDVVVGGGTTLRRLNRELARHGRALGNLGTLADQTVAGALAHGNHGSGLGLGPLADQVRGLTLVTATGAVRELTPSDGDAFLAATTSLGALGVVTAVRLATVPRFALRVRCSTVPLADVLGSPKSLERLAGSARHVSLSWLPWRQEVAVRTMEPTDVPPSRAARIAPWRTSVDEVRCAVTSVAENVWAAAPIVGARVPIPGGRDEQVLDSRDAFAFPQPVRFSALEHALPLDRTVEALVRVGRILRDAGRWSPYSVLVRFGAADASLLSPSSGRATGYVNLTVPRTTAFAEIHRSLEPALRELGGRPHWGKAHTATADDLRSLYPGWDDFLRVRKEFDPDHVLANAHLDRVLGR